MTFRRNLKEQIIVVILPTKHVMKFHAVVGIALGIGGAAHLPAGYWRCSSGSSAGRKYRSPAARCGSGGQCIQFDGRNLGAAYVSVEEAAVSCFCFEVYFLTRLRYAIEYSAAGNTDTFANALRFSVAFSSALRLGNR